MDTTYLGILGFGGLLVAPLVFGIVYRDTTRRRVSSSRRILLATVLSVSSFGGFLVPSIYEEELAYTYLHVIKPRPILISPYEWITVNVATGMLLSMIPGLLYFVSVRYSPSHQ